MALSVEPLTPTLGARVRGLGPATDISDADFATILDAFHEYSVLVLPDLPMTDESQVTFSARFGPLERTVASNPAGGSPFARQSNVDINTGELIPADDRRMTYQKGNYHWHADSTFKPVPSLCSILSAREVPAQGGATEFASTRAAWNALTPARQRELEGYTVEHDIVTSRKRLGFDFNEREVSTGTMTRAVHSLVQVNPVNGRRSVLIGSHASRIPELPEDASRSLLDELLELATTHGEVCRHEWSQDDVVIWDNRAALHRATAYDAGRYRRLMQRTTVSAGTAADV